jgi:hypothetical protein
MASQLTGTQGPSFITHDKVATVGCNTKFGPPQSKSSKTSVKLNIDGGIKMDAKNWQISFKQFSIGMAVSSLMSVSVLP